LIAFLQAEQRGERFILATPNARLAAPIIVRTGKAVMAMGGFSGLDPAIDGDTISRMVHEGQLRFVLIGGPGSYGGSEFAEGRRRAIVALAREQGARVDPAWRTEFPEGDVLQQRRQGARMRLWDLRAKPLNVNLGESE
jgi:4-amino-4-deoxy-L-arabinose transferase-like glycosyltransferase